MNINRENRDELNAVLTVKIEKPDYEERVDKILGDYRKKAQLNGFRPGKCPGINPENVLQTGPYGRDT
jgi:trigger factor